MMKKLFLLLLSVLLFVNVFTVSVRAEEETSDPSLPGEEQNETISGDADDKDIEDEDETVTIEADTSQNEENTDTTDEPVENGQEQTDETIENELPVQPEDGQKTEEPVEENGEITTVDLSEFVIQEGGFPEEEPEAMDINSDDPRSVLPTSFTAAENAIYNALKNRKSSLNVSSYQFSAAGIEKSVFKVINESPELFYVISTFGWDYSGSYVGTVYFAYDENYTSVHIARFNAAVDAIIATIDPEWSDLQKAMYLNDWLCKNSDYDFTYKRYNAYNAIVEGSAVCQGQALAYALLTKRAGLECHLVTSKDMDHAWDVLVIDGEYYYVDPTWNNSSGIFFDYAYFLCSRDELYGKDHGTKDWITCGINVYNNIPGSEKYSHYFWKELYIDKGVCYFERQAIYYDYSYNSNDRHSDLVFFDFDNEQINKTIETASSMYDTSGYFSAVADNERNIYYNSKDGIYRLNTNDESQELVYTLTDEELSIGYLYNLIFERNKIRYTLTDKSVMDGIPEMIGTLNPETLVQQDAISGELIIETDDQAMVSCLADGSSHIDIVLLDDSSRFPIYYGDDGELRKRDFFYDVTAYSLGDGCISISLDTLKTHNVPSGRAVIEIDYNGKNFTSSEINLTACIPAPAVSVMEEGNQLVIASDDPDYLAQLIVPDVMNYVEWYAATGGKITFVSDGKTGTIGNRSITTANYDTSSQDMVYLDETVTISAEALIDNGILNGEEVEATFSVYGYEKFTVTVPGGITIACIPGSAEFTMSQTEDGDIIIESENDKWLEDLARPAVYYGENDVFSMKDYGRISGTVNFSLNGQQSSMDFEINNSHYDTKDEINYFHENGRIIIPKQSLIDQKIPEGDCDLVLHAPEHEDNAISFHVVSPIQAFLPSDVGFYYSDTYGIMIYSQNTDWIRAIHEGHLMIYDRRGNSYYIDNSYRSAIKDEYYVYVSPGHLAGAGMDSNIYDVVLAPEGYINIRANGCNVRIPKNVKKIFIVSFFDEEGQLLKKEAVAQGAKAKAPSVPAKTGYSFDGWYMDGTKYDLKKGIGTNLDLYPAYKAVAYKITYNVNKGSITKTDVYDKTFSIETEELTLPVPSRKGYSFTGWYKDKTLTLPVDSIDDLELKNTTLYAKWEANEYSITFRSWDYEDITKDGYVYDKSYKLDNDIFEVPGQIVKKFSYSYVDAKGKTVNKTIAGNASIKNLVSEDGGNIVLSVAVTVNKKTGVASELWSDTKYTIKYSLPKGVKNGSKNPTKYSYSEDADVYRLNNPVLPGYDLLFWSYVDKHGEMQFIYPLNGNGTKDGYSYLPEKIHENLVLTPVFEDVPAVYSITYTGDLGSFSSFNPNPSSYSYSKTEAIRLLNPERSGYTFLGWYLNNKKITSIVKGTHGNLVLEARWK